MSISTLTLLAWGLVIGSYVLRAALWPSPEGQLFWNEWFRGEAGVLDRAEAVLWVPVIAINFAAFLHKRRDGLGLAALFHLGMAMLCVVLLGEEISWGQHLLGFDSPEELSRINAQQETNFHNLNLSLMMGLAPDNPLYPWFTNFNHVLNPAYYLASCILWIAFPVAKRALRWSLFATIPAPSSSTVLFLTINVLAYLVVDKLLFDVGEIFEFALTSTYLLAALETYRADPAAGIVGPDGRLVSRIRALRAGPAAGLAGHRTAMKDAAK
jgi:hypothetical protein